MEDFDSNSNNNSVEPSMDMDVDSNELEVPAGSETAVIDREDSSPSHTPESKVPLIDNYEDAKSVPETLSLLRWQKEHGYFKPIPDTIIAGLNKTLKFREKKWQSDMLNNIDPDRLVPFSVSGLKSKSQETTPNNNDDTCPYCEQKFVHKARMGAHLKNTCPRNLLLHKKPQPDSVRIFKCGKCSRVFADSLCAQSHAQTCMDKGEFDYTEEQVNKIYQCEYCDFLTSDSAVALQHIAKHPEGFYTCSRCCWREPTMKQIQEHWKNQCINAIKFREYLKPSDVPILFICNVCRQEFKSAKELQLHRFGNKHYEGIALHCPYCGEDHANEVEFHAHLEELHKEQVAKGKTNNKDRRKYLCEYCGRTFIQLVHLKTHIRFHTGEKPFKCIQCERRFAMRSDMLNHHRCAHTIERPYECKVCNKSFQRASIYYQHRKLHDPRNRFRCEVCGKLYMRPNSLKKHELKHSGEQP